MRIGHEFTDFEKATIIYNLSENIAIRNEKLVALQQETSDEVLRTQIQERLEYDRRVVEQFYHTDNGNSIVEDWILQGEKAKQWGVKEVHYVAEFVFDGDGNRIDSILNWSDMEIITCKEGARNGKGEYVCINPIYLEKMD